MVDSTTRPSRWRRAGALAGFVLLSFLLYGPILRESWANDDLIILQQIASHSAVELVGSREAWREFAPLYFFPMQLWSLKLDLALWGADPRPFRVRQLLELGLAAWLLFRLLEPRAGPAAATLGGALFLSGAATAVLAQQLMCRHYVDGVLLSLGAYAALTGATAPRGGRVAVASGLYLLAVLCKEVFAPLPLILLLCERPLRKRASVYAGLGGALLCAVFYRLAMVGAAPRVYRPDIWTAPALLQNARTLAASAGRVLLDGDIALQGLALALLVLPFVAAAGRRRLAIAAACLLGAAAPTLLVADVLGARHLVGVWTLLAAGAALGAAWISREMRFRAIAMIAAGSALVCALLGNRVRWAACLEESRLYTETCRFLLHDGHSGDFLLLPQSMSRTGYAFGPAGWLRRQLGDGAPVPGLLALDGAGVCVPELPPDGRYHLLVNGRVQQDRGFFERTRRRCAADRRDAPLTASARYHEGRLEWRLGPYADGAYAILVLGTDPEREVFAQMYGLPPSGAVWLLNGPRIQTFAFLYESPQGWFTATGPRPFERIEGFRQEWPAQGMSGATSEASSAANFSDPAAEK